MSTHITDQENIEPGITSAPVDDKMNEHTMAASMMGLNSIPIDNVSGINVEIVSTHTVTQINTESAISAVPLS